MHLVPRLQRCSPAGPRSMRSPPDGTMPKAFISMKIFRAKEVSDEPPVGGRNAPDRSATKRSPIWSG
jgi:hypothetical protein